MSVRISRQKKRNLSFGGDSESDGSPGEWPDDWEEDAPIVRTTRVEDDELPVSFWDAPEFPPVEATLDTESDLDLNYDTDETESEYEHPYQAQDRYFKALQQNDDQEQKKHTGQDEVAVRVNMLRVEEEDVPSSQEPTPLISFEEANYEENRFLQRLEKLEARRKHKIHLKRRYYERRNQIESALTEWWRRRILELRVYDGEVRSMLYREYDSLVNDRLSSFNLGRCSERECLMASPPPGGE